MLAYLSSFFVKAALCGGKSLELRGLGFHRCGLSAGFESSKCNLNFPSLPFLIFIEGGSRDHLSRGAVLRIGTKKIKLPSIV